MEKIEKYTVLRSPEDGQVYVIRNVEPRFTVKYKSGGELTDIVFTDFLDLPSPDPIELAKMMRGIGEVIARFLQKEAHEKRE